MKNVKSYVNNKDDDVNDVTLLRVATANEKAATAPARSLGTGNTTQAQLPITRRKH